MIKEGESLSDYLKALPKDFIRKEKNLKEEELKTLSELLNEIETTTDKSGKVLEKFVSQLFEYMNLHYIYLNKRTSTNEIDLFLKTNDVSRTYYNNTLPILSEDFIVECKQYHQKVKVTWVNKFYSLLRFGNYKLGIIFSVEPLTGKNDWDSSKGVCSKVALKDNIYIINLHLEDMKNIVDGYNVIDIIDEKYTKLKDNIAIDLIPHPHQKYLNP
ncbi:restriction endonuclease [Staphylococcus pseudintermedius]|uniref:restriction endonuclease n=1 Tax=Staphylococcus pseudintermedius TaxID=283734 RepID=UPI002ED86CCA|nr:restriction endonuclease [Staphylococcus pseudintermedius]MCE5603888.1 restriction endonuclease [Staphylococcus pseudintermedius]MCE5606218.1 restriction endonuclease [Staphylococcus pseudintermedius]MCE5608713.1 restriction endonuclease [Staphylococcus pseudintermedius]MCE5612998.1 restriction endonuclease [Staphylococcus pseudintermedius]